MNTRIVTITALALALGALVSLMAAFTGSPDAKTCRLINSITPHSCSTGPSTSWLTTAAILAGGALLLALISAARHARHGPGYWEQGARIPPPILPPGPHTTDEVEAYLQGRRICCATRRGESHLGTCKHSAMRTGSPNFYEWR